MSAGCQVFLLKKGDKRGDVLKRAKSARKWKEREVERERESERLPVLREVVTMVNYTAPTKSHLGLTLVW